MTLVGLQNLRPKQGSLSPSWWVEQLLDGEEQQPMLFSLLSLSGSVSYPLALPTAHQTSLIDKYAAAFSAKVKRGESLDGRNRAIVIAESLARL